MTRGEIPRSGWGRNAFRIVVLLAMLVFPALPAVASLAEDSSLYDAISEGDVQGVSEALKKGANPDRPREEMGISPLSLAARVPLFLRYESGREKIALEILKLLFEAGAKIGRKDITILHCAAVTGNTAILEFLVAKGADVNGEDGEGNSPLSLAIENDHPEVVEALLRHGARPMTPPQTAQIKFVAAARKGDTVKMNGLLSQGAQVDGKTPTGQTALVVAASAQQEVSVNWLLRNGADANLSAKQASLEAPPLWHAVLCNPSTFNLFVPLLLLRHGALVSPTDEHLKQTPLHLAVRLGNLVAVAMLLNGGADLKALDANGKTPLDYAEDEQIIKALKAAGAKKAAEASNGS